MEPVADLDALAAALRDRLLTESASEGPGDVERRIRALVEREAALLDADAREALVARVIERSFGLGPLEPLLRDPAVDEVMVNGVGPVWIERAGRLEGTDVRFASAGDLRDAIERILAPLGRRVDEAEPLCDARLPDAIHASHTECDELLGLQCRLVAPPGTHRAWARRCAALAGPSGRLTRQPRDAPACRRRHRRRRAINTSARGRRPGASGRWACPCRGAGAHRRLESVQPKPA